MKEVALVKDDVVRNLCEVSYDVKARGNDVAGVDVDPHIPVGDVGGEGELPEVGVVVAKDHGDAAEEDVLIKGSPRQSVPGWFEAEGCIKLRREQLDVARSISLDLDLGVLISRDILGGEVIFPAMSLKHLADERGPDPGAEVGACRRFGPGADGAVDAGTILPDPAPGGVEDKSRPVLAMILGRRGHEKKRIVEDRPTDRRWRGTA